MFLCALLKCSTFSLCSLGGFWAIICWNSFVNICLNFFGLWLLCLPMTVGLRPCFCCRVIKISVNVKLLFPLVSPFHTHPNSLNCFEFSNDLSAKCMLHYHAVLFEVVESVSVHVRAVAKFSSS